MSTIKEVAQLAEVSVATVSRVLNNKGYVHHETREKVLSAIQQLNYYPNEVARSLFKRESRMIGFILPDIRNPFFPEVARGAEDEIQSQGFHLIMGNSDEKLEKELQYIQTFQQNNVMGLLTITNLTDTAHYENLSIPTVFIDRSPRKQFAVYADGREGGRTAARELAARGCRKITVMRGPDHLLSAQERFQGAMEVLGEEDVEVQVVKTSSFAYAEAQQWAEQLFTEYKDTDGVIASNDIIAAAVLHQALETGRKVPDDVQIIGFDDIPQSSLFYPALSTIRQPAYEMGREAAKLLLSIIQNETEIERQIVLPTEYINRQTTKKERNRNE